MSEESLDRVKEYLPDYRMANYMFAHILFSLITLPKS